jgi:DNA-binding beta-propeller fold protein YncE
MKKKLVSILAVAFACILVFGTVTATAAVPYDTYTYSTDGTPRRSPNAYIPSGQRITASNMSSETVKISYEGLAQPEYEDICTDSRGYVYIVDKANGQIIVLNNGYKAEMLITTFDSDTKRGDSLKSPQGIFVNDDYIYVCDTGNSRIVMFDLEGNFCKTVRTNDADMKPYKSFLFTPVSCVADQYGRLFVVSSDSSYGIVVMDDDGTFNGFIGAPKVTYSVMEMFFRRFQSEEERSNAIAHVAAANALYTLWIPVIGICTRHNSSFTFKKQSLPKSVSWATTAKASAGSSNP